MLQDSASCPFGSAPLRSGWVSCGIGASLFRPAPVDTFASIAVAITGVFTWHIVARRHATGSAKLSFRVAPHRVVAESHTHDAEEHLGVIHHSGERARIAASGGQD